MTLPQLSVYDKLLKDIQSIHARARGEAAVSLNAIRLKMFWEIGRAIVRVEKMHQGKVTYGAQTLERLAEDLTQFLGKGFNLTSLRKMRRFYETHPRIRPNSVGLGWSQHQLLLGVTDDKARKKLEQACIQHQWKLKDLKKEIQCLGAVTEALDQQEALMSSKTSFRSSIKLALRRGVLNLFTIHQTRYLGGELGEKCLDLGFMIYYTEHIAKLKNFKPKDVIELQGPPSQLTAVASNRRKDQRYTYAATCDRVVDGDTLKVSIKLGFDIIHQVRLRLRGIDAPEIDTPAGEKAKGFLQRTCDAVDILVIKTYGTDMYDRYLTDVFYLPGETDPAQIAAKGHFLNQELLDSGLVTPYLPKG